MKGEPGSSTSATRSRGSSCPRLWKRSFAAADAARVRSSSARIRAISASIPPRLVLKAAPDGEMADSITAMDSLARHCERSKAIHALGAPRWIASLAMTALMLRSENLSRFRRAGDLAAGAAGTAGDLFDQLAVRRHLGAVGEIERIFQACAQMAAKIGAALVQRPDFGAADRSDLPAALRQLQLEQDRQQFRIGRHARRHAHHEIILQRPGIHPGLHVHVDATDNADIETFEFRNRARHLHDVEIVLYLLDRVIEHHRRPGPIVVGLDLEIIQRTGIARRDLWLGLPHAIERALIVRT